MAERQMFPGLRMRGSVLPSIRPEQASALPTLSPESQAIINRLVTIFRLGMHPPSSEENQVEDPRNLSGAADFGIGLPGGLDRLNEYLAAALGLFDTSPAPTPARRPAPPPGVNIDTVARGTRA